MKHNFKIGDRVKIRSWDDMAKQFGTDRFGDIECMPFFVTSMKYLCGRTATITDILQEFNGKKVCLKFDDTRDDVKCWQYTTDMITPLVPNEKIVITTDGTTTTAKMYRGKEVVKTATANCSRDDEFNFETGAKIAFDRLVKDEPEKPKFKIGDFVKIKSCTHYGHNFPVGVFVEIKNILSDGDMDCFGYCVNVKRNGYQRVNPVDVEVVE